MTTDGTGLEVIDREECLRLLSTVPIGRIVYTDRALPAIQPVNFTLDGDAIVIRTGVGSKLAAAVRNAVVAFEIDQFEPVTHAGWSVIVTGRAAEVRDPAELDRLEAVSPQPWAPGSRDHVVRIDADLVTGRRIPAASAAPLSAV